MRRTKLENKKKKKKQDFNIICIKNCIPRAITKLIG